MESLVVLGTVWASAENSFTEPRGRLGWRSGVRRVPVEFLDWTVDDVPLRSLLGLPKGGLPNERTLMVKGFEQTSFATSSLVALLDEHGGYEEAGDDWVSYDDGRTAILYCPECGALDCPSITARIEFTDSTVRWRDIAYQTEFPDLATFDTFDPVTLVFAREQYEASVRSLLTVWRAPDAEG